MFPQIGEILASPLDAQNITLSSPSHPNNTLCLEAWEGLTRIALHHNADPSAPTGAQSELTLLRATVKNAPYLLWQESSDSDVIWANDAYLGRISAQQADLRTWPLPPLFATETIKNARGGAATRRLKITEGQEQWFDVTCVHHDESYLFFACPADEIVKAERSLHDFVQTLTKTFAELPTGLAIFNRDRELTLFNPALSDLLNMPVDMLIGRPKMPAFFDKMRELRMLPEQKAYAEWRDGFLSIGTQDSIEPICQTWDIPNGSTFQVTAKPHSEGAITLMFEDVTQQVSSTRKNRSAIEQHRAILDASPEAIAVFDPSGALTFCNAAYRTMWKVDPDAAFGQMTVTDCTRHWAELSDPTPLWGDIRDCLNGAANREAWTDQIQMKDGTQTALRMTPLADGRFVVGFMTSELPTRARTIELTQ
nr:PAS-domain containing protein [Nereida sp. MMG025]